MEGESYFCPWPRDVGQGSGRSSFMREILFLVRSHGRQKCLEGGWRGCGRGCASIRRARDLLVGGVERANERGEGSCGPHRTSLAKGLKYHAKPGWNKRRFEPERPPHARLYWLSSDLSIVFVLGQCMTERRR